ncbi:hypothetical protein [Halapricum salinum]|uniref:Uncharacterized protein n=1 Tax=Halapricum salinum TaxID=1457250 RepID=A0A4D6HAD2_9EURY|nr:hypothetical protein [Halapricum salinum]QCC51034.1 hypothetical protein DV733_07150 [Halapricum salinum]
MASDRTDRVGIAIAVAAVVVLLYSAFFAAALLLGLIVVVGLVVLYLLWRFVRAAERIATALEAQSPE